MGQIWPRKKQEEEEEEEEEEVEEWPMEMPMKEPNNSRLRTTMQVAHEDLYLHFDRGVFPSHKRKKNWIDELDCNCLMLLANDLAIIWGDDERYWRWCHVKEARGVDFEVAFLSDVCWLEVRGQLDSFYLLPGVTYEVALVVMIKEPSHGWDIPVTLELQCPEEAVQQRIEILQDKPKNRWLELQLGSVVKPSGSGTIKVSLIECKHLHWKGGLIIQGAIFRPKLA